MIWWSLMGCAGDCGEVDACSLTESCQDGQCVARVCSTSTQCPLDYHCTPDGSCEEGCRADGDCPVGSSCRDGACEADPCVDANVDCGFGEWCERGKCAAAGDPYCKACTTDDQCGAGNICWAGQWCGVDCSADERCPAAYECDAVDHTDGQRHEVCLGACWLFATP